jgi:Domain of unknown function (DUF1707)
MGGPENEMAADSGRGRLRASDADREHVVGTLKAAYVHGLVTKDEFDARVSQTFASRTYAELALITADIPAELAAAPPAPRPGPAKANPPARANLTPGERAVMATGLFAALALVVALLAGGLGGGIAGPGGSRQRFRVRVPHRSPGAQLTAQHALRQSPASQRATQSGPGAGRPAASAPPAEQLPNPSKPRRRSGADAALRHSLNPQLSS